MQKTLIYCEICDTELDPVERSQLGQICKQCNSEMLKRQPPIQEFEGASLSNEEASLLEELKEQVNYREIIQLTEDESDLERIFGFVVEDFNVVGLSLINLDLNYFPASLTNFVHLKFLYLDDNSIPILPASIGNLHNLQKLRIRNNKLKSIPESIGNLINLNYLNLKGNQITSLPMSIQTLKNLEILFLNGNRLADLTTDTFFKLTTLSLADNNFEHFPKSLLSIKSLRKLDLSNNYIKDLPGDFPDKLVNLNYLNLSNNSLFQLPDAISQLIDIKRLNLQNNRLSSLPIGLKKLISLNFLNLEHNFELKSKNKAKLLNNYTRTQEFLKKSIIDPSKIKSKKLFDFWH